MNKISMKFIYGILAGACFCANISCNKYLDINTSPLTATAVEPKLLFGYAVTAWDANKNSGDAWIPIGLMTQNMASGGDYGWEKSNLYNISSYSIGNTWKVYYSTAGNNLKQAIKVAEAADPVNHNAAAQSKIVLAQLVYEVTTLYGDVPFAEAWDPENYPYPKYDKQKDVLNGVIALLDEAIAQIDESNPLKIADYDIYYKGDMAKWKKLANSIKFKTYMVMADADPTVEAKIGELLHANTTMISNQNESWIHKYYTTVNNENPKYRLLKTYTNGQNQWFFANVNVFNYMDAEDPRMSRYFEQGSLGTYVPVETEENANEETSLISSYLYRPDAPSIILSYQEILLLQAEAYVRGLGVSQDLNKANELFKEAVKVACLFYEADVAATADYVEHTLVDLTTASNPLREIHLQQWIDLMDRPVEAFVQWRRSGVEGQEVPALTVPPGATSGPLIRRWVLSPEETAANPNIPNPQPKHTDKMWFDL